MDAAGIDLQVLSHTASASEAFPAEQAVRLAQPTNEEEGLVWLVGWSLVSPCRGRERPGGGPKAALSQLRHQCRLAVPNVPVNHTVAWADANQDRGTHPWHRQEAPR
jgi:hypothetical protein